MRNQSKVTEFILQGFSDSAELQIVYFVVFLIIYIIAVAGNLLIITIIKSDPQLHTPMYFFVGNLSILDTFYISTTVPKMLVNCLSTRKTISFSACVAQLSFFLSMAATESALLATMAYDRYVAICNPLRYSIIVNKKSCIFLAAASWFIGIVYSVIHTSNTFRLNFCGSNVINHYFCDIPPLLKLSCSDTNINVILVFLVGGLLMLGCFVLILTSYVNIIKAILKISSAKGRSKTFSTCISHLTTVALFYITGSCVYFRPASTHSLDQEKIGALFYSVIAPMLNPYIYSLRNKDLKGAIIKVMRKKLIFQRH
ncbi:olfactory receptor 1019-like [Rhinatrema bivittatum]|uniref:olfactory receptor 1019-like n=1 Tax=Rhinatrema bivittatum TaxID=194408 RepID=UPI001125DF09|nr:olfactory receptor 1019-like [Rhinatrema bivittatum]